MKLLLTSGGLENQSMIDTLRKLVGKAFPTGVCSRLQICFLYDLVNEYRFLSV